MDLTPAVLPVTDSQGPPLHSGESNKRSGSRTLGTITFPRASILIREALETFHFLLIRGGLLTGKNARFSDSLTHLVKTLTIPRFAPTKG